MRRSVFLCALARIRAEMIYKRRKICYNGGMKALREHKRTAHDVSRIAISVALISVCSWISIPVGASVKYTLQLLAVFVCCASLGAKRGFAAVAVYAVIGLVGLPVFAGFSAGPSATTGFVLGFLPAAVLVGCGRRLADKKIRFRFALRIALMLGGLLLCYAVGTVWFMIWTDCGLVAALAFTVLPYFVFDLVKTALAAYLSERIGRIQ